MNSVADPERHDPPRGGSDVDVVTCGPIHTRDETFFAEPDNLLETPTSSGRLESHCETVVESPSQRVGHPSTTPLPLQQMIIVAAAFLNEALLASMLFPFVGNLVSFIGEIPIAEAGFVSGALIASFYLGQALGGSFWGAMSDTFGRRPALMCGLFLGSLMTLLFGMSGSILALLATRFLQGVFNGNIAVAKVVITDITDETNRAVGFVVINLTCGLGTFAGMFIGGVLYGAFNEVVSGVDAAASNAKAMEAAWAETFLRGHPAFLPCLVSACYGFLILALVFRCLRETAPSIMPMTSSTFFSWAATRLPLARDAAAGIAPPATPEPFDREDKKSESETAIEMTVATHVEVTNPQGVLSFCNGEDVARSETVADSLEQHPTDTLGKFGLSEMIAYLPTRHALIAYLMTAGHDIAIGEVFALWSVAPRAVGGLGLSVRTLGLTSTLGGCFVLIANFTFPAIHARVSEGLLFQASAVACAGSYLMTPFIPRVVASMYPTSSFAIRTPMPPFDGATGDFDPQIEETALNMAIWLVVATIFLRVVFVDYVFVFNLMRVSESAPRRFIGVATGLSQSLAAIVRMVAPALATPLFAVTARWAQASDGGAVPEATNSNGPMLDFLLTTPLVFIICGAVCVASALHDAYVHNLRRTPLWVRTRDAADPAQGEGETPRSE